MEMFVLVHITYGNFALIRAGCNGKCEIAVLNCNTAKNPFAWIGRLQSGIMKYHPIFKAWGFHPMDKAAADIRH